MDSKRGILLVASIVALVFLVGIPCSGSQDKNKQEQKKEDLWDNSGRSQVERPGQGPGLQEPPPPGRGPGSERGPGDDRGPGDNRGPGGGRGGRFELTDEELNRIMDGIRQRDPEKAKEMEELRQKDPDRFRSELRKHAGEEFGVIMKERMENFRRDRQNEFIEFLEKYVPKEAQELSTLKDRDPELYSRKYDLARQKYERVSVWAKRSPEMAEVLVADIQLQDKQDELVGKIKAAKNEQEKEKLMAQLKEVVGNKYDLIVRRKQIAYEWLLKRLEALQKEVNENKNEIIKYMDEKAKEENVKERVKYLTEDSLKLKWD